MNKKAQADAPFEILVAVIIMGFVLIIGATQMQAIQKTQCESNIANEINELSNAIESAVKQQSKQEIHFSLPSCFTKSTASIGVQRIINDPVRCKRLCPSQQKESCVVLEFYSEELTPLRKCLNIPPTTIFSDPSSKNICDPNDEFLEDGFVLANITTETALAGSYLIENGTYLILNRRSLTEINPRLCIFKK